MESNKFEKQLREQLRKREIKPSEEAWNRISQQLEASEKAVPASRRSSARQYRWYGIAAGFVGILFVSALYFTTNTPLDIPENEVTDVMEDSSPLNTSPSTASKENLFDKDALVDRKAQEEDRTEGTIQRHPNRFRENALAGSKGESTKRGRDLEPEKVVVPRKPSEEIIDAKVAEVVAQVAVLEEKNSTVTDAEIDSLLRGAQREILEDKIFRKDRTVDAVALLADVEGELDRSFRDQIFDALKDGFLKVRTAVADRNR